MSVVRQKKLRVVGLNKLNKINKYKKNVSLEPSDRKNNPRMAEKDDLSGAKK